MKSLATITLLLVLCSCGKIKLEAQVPDVKFGPNFEQASAFCDNKYGVGMQASEECFEDYRKFLSPRVQVDLASISNFCQGSYTTPEDIQGCEKDLLEIIRNATK